MGAKLGFTGSIVAGGLIGAFVLSVLFILWTWLFEPKLFGDGQYGMIFFVTCPVGWMVGSIAGSLIGFANAPLPKPSNALLSSAGWTIGGAIAVAIPGMILMNLLCAIIGSLFASLKR